MHTTTCGHYQGIFIDEVVNNKHGLLAWITTPLATILGVDLDDFMNLLSV